MLRIFGARTRGAARDATRHALACHNQDRYAGWRFAHKPSRGASAHDMLWEREREGPICCPHTLLNQDFRPRGYDAFPTPLQALAGRRWGEELQRVELRDDLTVCGGNAGMRVAREVAVVWRCDPTGALDVVSREAAASVLAEWPATPAAIAYLKHGKDEKRDACFKDANPAPVEQGTRAWKARMAAWWACAREATWYEDVKSPVDSFQRAEKVLESVLGKKLAALDFGAPEVAKWNQRLVDLILDERANAVD